MMTVIITNTFLAAYMPKLLEASIHHTVSFNLHCSLIRGRQCYHPHFTDEDIGTQRGEVTCPKSHSKSAARLPGCALHHLLFRLSQVPLPDQGRVW